MGRLNVIAAFFIAYFPTLAAKHVQLRRSAICLLVLSFAGPVKPVLFLSVFQISGCSVVRNSCLRYKNACLACLGALSAFYPSSNLDLLTNDGNGERAYGLFLARNTKLLLLRGLGLSSRSSRLLRVQGLIDGLGHFASSGPRLPRTKVSHGLPTCRADHSCRRE